MFKNIKWLRLTPDRPGRGGSKTGFHSFQQEPVNDVRSLYGGHVYQGAWRRDFTTVPYPAVQATVGSFGQPYSIHGYVYPSLTDPSATPGVTVLCHELTDSGGLGNRVIEVATGATRGGPYISGNTSPGVFQNISGRCFFCEGSAEAMIFDDRVPAIHAQKNQNIGVGTPQQPLTSTGTPVGGDPPNLSPAGTGYIHSKGAVSTAVYINHPDPDNMIGTILATDTVTPFIIDPNYTVYSGAVMGAGNPTVDAVTSNTTAFAAAGTISITSGTSLVTLAGSTWPANYAYCGLAINFNGYSFIISETIGDAGTFDLDGNNIAALTNVQLLILGVYDGPTVTAVPYTITGCRVTMPTSSTLSMTTTGTLGYAQTTHANLVQIHVFATRAAGYYRNLGNISLGPASNTEASGGSIQTITDAFMPYNLKKLTSASNPFTLADEGAPISVEDGGGVNITLITTIETFVTPGMVYLAAANKNAGAIGPVAAWWGNNPTISDAVMDNNVTFNLTSASNPFVVGDVGQPIVVEGAALNAPLITTIATYAGPGQVTLAAKNTSGAAISGKHAWWKAISTLVTAGPTYAYAWYDPETGHMSNISPLYQVPRPVSIGLYRDFANITPVFQIDSGFIAYPVGLSGSGADGNRFSHIMFFRTLSTPGSSTLYPIGSLNPYIGKVHPGAASTRGSWNPMTFRGWTGIPNNYIGIRMVTPPTAPNYWYDFSSDSDLLLSGGFRAPQFTNEKPMVLLRGGITQPGYPCAMAYWDRRLWIVNTQEPDKIAFSCDDAQCPLGVPIESFPPTNFLRLPSVDARVIGMRTVGDMLLVTTERWAYIIAGNNESNYRLMKISASMPGVGTYQMDEFPTSSAVEGQPATLFFLGRDRIVYQWTVGGSAVPISRPIQDQLDKVLSGNLTSPGFTPLLEYQNSRVHCVSAWGRQLVIVAPNGIVEIPSQGPSKVLIYDVSNQTWSEGFHNDIVAAGGDAPINGLAPMTTIYGLDVPANEIFAIASPVTNNVRVLSWLRDDLSATANAFGINTFPINFDGKKTRKQIVAMNLHATSGTWTGGVNVNEQTVGAAATFGAYPDPLNSIYAPASFPVDAGAADIVVMAAQFTNPSAPIVGYRFVFTVQKNADALPAKIYALDIGYIDYEEQGDGEP